jgi:5-formyltetrahydrofolate cyclo-ligase
MNSSQMKKAKRDVRVAVVARRDALTPADRDAQATAINERFLALEELSDPGTSMAFWSFGSEVATAGLIEAMVAAGWRVALPAIVGADLEARVWNPGDPTIPTSFGAMEPADGELVEPESLDVVIAPGVAFDASGARIGYGGGFYDRFLPRLRAQVPVIALAFDLQVLDGPLPGGAFDRGVDVIVTPTRTVRCRPRR